MWRYAIISIKNYKLYKITRWGSVKKQQSYKKKLRQIYTTAVPNCSSFDFFTLSLTAHSIQKICANIAKFKSFLNILYW